MPFMSCMSHGSLSMRWPRWDYWQRLRVSVSGVWQSCWSIFYLNHEPCSTLSVVPRVVAEDSQQETYKIGCLLWIMDGRAKPLMDRKVVGASRFLSVYLSACLSIKLMELVKLVRLVRFVRSLVTQPLSLLVGYLVSWLVLVELVSQLVKLVKMVKLVK